MIRQLFGLLHHVFRRDPRRTTPARHHARLHHPWLHARLHRLAALLHRLPALLLRLHVGIHPRLTRHTWLHAHLLLLHHARRAHLHLRLDFLLLRLLLLEKVDAQTLKGKADYVVAIDSVGANAGEIVFYVTGSSARMTDATKGKPSDATIIAIVDAVEMDGALTYDKAAGS